MSEVTRQSDAHIMMRALRAARAIAWDCDLRTGLVTHQAAMEVFGVAPLRSPLALKHALRFVYRKDRHAVIARSRVAVRHREPFVQHFRVVLRPGDDPIWVECHAEIVFDEAGQPAFLGGALVDITAHRRALDALAAADRRKDEFVAILAHELRNPLSAIAVAAQVLKSSALDPAQLNTCVDMIRRQAAHLSRLVEDLLDMSRVIRDGLEFRHEPVDLCSAVAAALETTDGLIRSRHHTLKITTPPQPVHVQADPVRLAQIFGNLLANAAKYTPQGGSIHVAVESDANWAVIRVRDSGVGIAPEELPHVFEPFYQANPGGSAPGGLGIGLALVQRIVQLHGGTIEASSAGHDRGSEFIVRLPALSEWRDPRSSHGAASSVDLDSARPLRILIADDNVDVAEAFALGLRMCGHEVTVAFDGDEALRIADEFRPQVALLDLTMPKRPGHEVAVELRKRPWARERGILIIALTGWKISDLHGGTSLSGFDSQIMKPAEIETVNRLVVNAYGHARVGSEVRGVRSEFANDV